MLVSLVVPVWNEEEASKLITAIVSRAAQWCSLIQKL